MTECDEVADSMRAQAPRFASYAEAIAYVSKLMPGEDGAMIHTVATALCSASPVTVQPVDGRIEVQIAEGGGSSRRSTLSIEQVLQLQDDLSTALLEAVKESRWRCPECESTHVQVSIPTWYRETLDGTLLMVNTDGEADAQFWYCEECDASGSGEPQRA